MSYLKASKLFITSNKYNLIAKELSGPVRKNNRGNDICPHRASLTI